MFAEITVFSETSMSLLTQTSTDRPRLRKICKFRSIHACRSCTNSSSWVRIWLTADWMILVSRRGTQTFSERTGANTDQMWSQGEKVEENFTFRLFTTTIRYFKLYFICYTERDLSFLLKSGCNFFPLPYVLRLSCCFPNILKSFQLSRC